MQLYDDDDDEKVYESLWDSVGEMTRLCERVELLDFIHLYAKQKLISGM